MRIEQIAAICHEANKAYCEQLGDSSQVSWVDAPEWQKISSTQMVVDVLSGLSTAEQVHQAWMDQKIADGWSYGSVKDPTAKTHPCLVSYSDLSSEERGKDLLFRSIVQALFSV